MAATVGRRSWTHSVGIALAALAALGAGMTVLAALQARDDAGAHAQQTIADVAQQFTMRLQSSLASLRGSDGLAVDGEVTAAEFEAFANDILTSSSFVALAYSEVVPEADRARWESLTGHPMHDLTNGTFVDAASRPEHVVVRHVRPVDDLTVVLYGFDLLSDPTRSAGIEAARGRGDSVVGPIELAGTGAPGVFLTQAVSDPDGAVVGFVSAGVSITTLLGGPAALSDVSHVRLWIDDQLALTADAGPGVASRIHFEVADHSFTLEAIDDHGPSWGVASIIGLCTVLLLAALIATLLQARRERERDERAASRGRHLADLREVLANSSDTAHVIRSIATNAGRALGADWTGVGRRDGVARGGMNVQLHEEATRSVIAVNDHDSEIDRVLPLGRCMRDGTLIVVPEHSDQGAAVPPAASNAVAAAVRTAVCAPLGLANERTIGAVGFGWNHELPRRELAEAIAATQLIAQLAGRALERALVREVVQERVTQLSDFTKSLSTVRSTSEIESLVDQYLPRLLDVQAATIGSWTDPQHGVVRTYTAPHPQGRTLHLAMPSSMEWTPTLHALAEAVIELVQGAWTRASEQEQEHLVLKRLQASLLLPAPDIPGFDIAVSYRSALATVEIGGDWYSVIDQPNVVNLLVGDVAGHGAGAVAIMAESKTILRHLISGGTAIRDALEQASAALSRRHAYASVIAVTIDKRTGVLSYLNAGHPAPILVTEDGTVTLDHVHRAWLGVDDSSRPETTVAFPRGAQLLLYTDGLIEDRRVPLDVSIARLAIDVAACACPPAELVERLINARAGDDGPTVVDDDIAMIAVERL